MPRLVEMGTLIERCKRRADKENDDHIAAAEWRAFIHEVWGADVFQVVADVGLRYFETTATLTTTGVAYVSEPANHARTIRIDYIDSAGARFELTQVMPEEQRRLGGLTTTDRARFYALVDDRIYLYPTPPTAQEYEILYIPQAPDVSGYADDECVDCVSADGEALIYWGVAALAKIKASQDASFFVQKQEALRDRLMAWAVERSLTEPMRQIAVHTHEVTEYEEGDYRS